MTNGFDVTSKPFVIAFCTSKTRLHIYSAFFLAGISIMNKVVTIGAVHIITRSKSSIKYPIAAPTVQMKIRHNLSREVLKVNLRMFLGLSLCALTL